MALKSATTNVNYVKWSEVALNTVIQAFYMETKTSEKYGNLIHYIETVEGTRYGLNGSANLDRAIEQVRQGWYIELTYLGPITLEKGKFAGKECHQFDLKYDDDRIHPFFSGDASARAEVEYKNSQAEPAAEPAASAPALVKPESAQAAPPQPAPQQPAASAPAAPATAGAAPKRSIF